MQITLTSKEFDEAVSLWLQDQGFSTNTHSISTRVIAGRSDGPLGTRVEVTLEPIPDAYRNAMIHSTQVKRVTPVFEATGSEDVPFPTARRFGQGHADE